MPGATRFSAPGGASHRERNKIALPFPSPGPVETSTLDRLVDNIESDLQNTLKREVSTKEIGEKVMEGLKDIDEVAYVRFASVYRQFKDVTTFIAEVNKLLVDKN